MNEEQMIRRDRMRYKRNKVSANLALLAILLDVLYFVNIYQNDAGSYYHNWKIGVSIVYNLIFMLAAFLAEEGVKNYKKAYSIPLVVLGVIQIARIFIIPMQAHNATYSYTVESTKETIEAKVMSDGQFTYLVVLLILSAICLFASAVINLVRCNALAAHMKMLEENSAAGALAQKSA